MRLWQLAAALLVIGLASTVEAESPRGLATRWWLVRGLMNGFPELKAELKVTEAQDEILTAQRAELRAASFAIAQDPTTFQKRREEIEKKADETTKLIFDGKQKQRLWELMIQREGAMTLSWPEVAEDLGVDQPQKERIKKIQADATEELTIIIRDNVASEKTSKLLDKIREKAKAELLAVLTADQRERFQKMQGAKFTFPMPEHKPK